MTVHAYHESLLNLLPPGMAFPRDAGSVVSACLYAQAQLLQDLETDALHIFEQWLPHKTCTRLEEWEEALGLPDDCCPSPQTLQTRISNVLARFAMYSVAMPIDDHSRGSPGYLAAVAAAGGYDVVDIWYNWPFRVGRNRVGERLGGLDGRLNIKVRNAPNYVCEPFRVGVHRVGRRLLECHDQAFECLMDKIVPARFVPRYIYV